MVGVSHTRGTRNPSEKGVVQLEQANKQPRSGSSQETAPADFRSEEVGTGGDLLDRSDNHGVWRCL